AAVTGDVGHGTEDGDGHVAASVAGRWRIKSPGARTFCGFVRHADDGRLGRVNHRHLQAAIGGVPAGIGRPPGARGVVGIATVTSGVGHGVEDGNSYGATGVVGNGRVKVPGARALDGLVAYAGNRRFSGVHQGHLLTALGCVPAGISRPPGACGVESIAAVTGEVSDGTEDADGHAAASVGRVRRIKGPVAVALDGLV